MPACSCFFDSFVGRPFCLDGYTLSIETGFYYLQSRYYDPELGRFINADSFASTGQGFLGYNMFAYCGNNPGNNLDPTGHLFVEIWEWITGKKDKLEKEISDIVFNQNAENVSDIRYGSSTLGKSGCGVIAVHNALILLGRNSNLLDVRDYFQKKSKFRVFGTGLSEIKRYLAENDISYKNGKSAYVIEKTKGGGVAIVTLWNKIDTQYVSYPNSLVAAPIKVSLPIIFEGAHTVAITYDSDKYWNYNAFSDSTSAFGCSDYEEYLEGGVIGGIYIP